MEGGATLPTIDIDYSEVENKLPEKEFIQLQQRLSRHDRRLLIYEHAKAEGNLVVSLAIGEPRWEFMSFQMLEFKSLIFNVIKENTLLVRLD